MKLKNSILEKFNSGEFEYKGAKRIFELLGVKSNFEKDIIRSVLNELESDGVIVYDNGKYLLLEHSGFIKGVLKGNERGFAFLIPEDKTLGDYFIPARNLNGALNGDTVIIKKVAASRTGSSDEGVVTQILSRGVKKLTGTFQGENGFGFVIADDKAFSVDVYVPFKLNNGAKTGDKVLVEIVAYPEGRKNPEGRVIEILGKKHDLKAEELSIIKNAGYELEFPSKVLKAVKEIPLEVSEKERIGRRDFTSDLVVTIDGEDSRDFDDAISVVENKNGTFTLSVHIADVSHYVKRGSVIDAEALSRSNSVYFPERVIPMLPFELSNGICSLNEGVNRLTLSCIMTINANGEIIDSEIVEGVIKSKRRLTYTVVQKMLDGDSETLNAYADVKDMIFTANKLMLVLSSKRKKRGNIDLSVKESHIFVNENGKIVVEPRQSVTAYKIIEEFMIAANETVAEYIYHLDLPFVYRVHEKPNEDKLAGFVNFINALGINVKWTAETCHPKDFQSLLESVENEAYYGVVNKVMLRSMQKAKYFTENIGHFGLSSKCYCHFTSPIRRYPDLTVHAVLKGVINGNLDFNYYNNYVGKVANVSSENEKRADEVERAMDDYYKCRYMRSFIGKEFTGVISGVTGFGIFVELENTIEGICRLETLPRGSYTFNEKTFTLSSNKWSFTLGERVAVKVVGVDFSTRRVEFLLTEKFDG
ncbi:MAG: ribonuclease R [Clostridia bacterium]|nr:ribonuclease R [Clostridia bacterium]